MACLVGRENEAPRAFGLASRPEPAGSGRCRSAGASSVSVREARSTRGIKVRVCVSRSCSSAASTYARSLGKSDSGAECVRSGPSRDLPGAWACPIAPGAASPPAASSPAVADVFPMNSAINSSPAFVSGVRRLSNVGPRPRPRRWRPLSHLAPRPSTSYWFMKIDGSPMLRWACSSFAISTSRTRASPRIVWVRAFRQQIDDLGVAFAARTCPPVRCVARTP